MSQQALRLDIWTAGSSNSVSAPLSISLTPPIKSSGPSTVHVQLGSLHPKKSVDSCLYDFRLLKEPGINVHFYFCRVAKRYLLPCVRRPAGGCAGIL